MKSKKNGLIKKIRNSVEAVENTADDVKKVIALATTALIINIIADAATILLIFKKVK